MREHAERRGVDQGVELAAVHLLAQQGLGAAGAGQRSHAVGIASHDGNFRAAADQRIRRAASRSAVADHQHRRFRQTQLAGQRNGDGIGVGVRAAPLAGFFPDRVDGADAARQRIDHVEVAQDLLLVRNGNAEAGHRQRLGQDEKILQLRRLDQKRKIHRVHAMGLKRAIVDGRARWSGAPDRQSRHRSWRRERTFRRDTDGAARERSPGRTPCLRKHWARRT